MVAYSAAREERTREHVPLDWAMRFGNQGVALCVLAARREDAALAGQALTQIKAGLAVYRDAGHAPGVEIGEAKAAEARQLLQRLWAGRGRQQ